MSHDSFQSLPIDESILAALVEGDLGGREADAVRERLLAADPDLAARVELMERDRVMLRALGDETPPTGLAESVVARLEREALLGLSGGEADRGELAVSVVRPVRRRSGVAGWMTSPAGAGLAMAAVLTLAVGAAMYFSGGNSPVPVAPVETAAAGLLPGGTALAQESTGRDPAVLGEAPAPPPAAEGQMLAAETPAPTVDPDAVFTDDTARALALLAEGRLLIRVRAAAPDEATSELARLVARPVRPNEAYRLVLDVPQPVALAMETRFAPAPAPDRGPTAFASADDEGTAPEARRVRSPEPRSPLEAVYLADARQDGAALASLRHALSLGNGRVAVFEELAQPLQLPRVLAPDAVLWWNRPASEWSRRAYVPVVVERVER